VKTRPSQALLSNNAHELDYHGNQEATNDSNQAASGGQQARYSRYNTACTPSFSYSNRDA
jgi:hypothetical protein